MSTVVGLKTKKKIVIGADTRLTDMGNYTSKPIIKHKIIKNKHYYISYVGSVRHGDLFEDMNLPKDIKEWPIFFIEIFTFHRCLETFEDNENKPRFGTNIIVCDTKTKRLFEILDDFQINEIEGEGFTAIGSGLDMALGSLYTSENIPNLSERERVRLALEAAEKYDIMTGSPFDIVEVNI